MSQQSEPTPERYTEPGYYVMWHPSPAMTSRVSRFGAVSRAFWFDQSTLDALAEPDVAIASGWRLFPVHEMTKELGEPKDD